MSQEQFNWLMNKAKELMHKTKDPNHSWAHIERVINNAERISELLMKEGKKKVDKQIIKLAAAWHDISYIKHGASFFQYLVESWRSKKIVIKYFNQVGVAKDKIKLISSIILHHDWAELFILRGIVLNKSRTVYHQIVQDADTIDLFSRERTIVAEKNINKSLFTKIILRFFKPIFYNFLIKNKRYFLNLKVSEQLLKE